MMRSLWTAASGMKTQQGYIDSIANNLANVNSIGFKKNGMEFKALFYETMKGASVDANGFGNPTNLQVGNGVRTVSSIKDFRTGSIDTTDNPLDFAIQGAGFFGLVDDKGNEMYTKAGAFRISLTADEKIRFSTADGKQLMSTDGEPLEIDANFQSDKLKVDQDGKLFYTDGEGVSNDLGIQIAIVQFNNPAGLKALGGSYYQEGPASGEPRLESEEKDKDMSKSSLLQGALEASNVQVVEEMVKMIVAQRAYELNTKAIQTSDDMLGMTNNLKR